MTLRDAAPWHTESWNRFVEEDLPALLAERLPDTGLSIEKTGPYTCRLEVLLGGLRLVYDDIPRPDEAGIFKIDGGYRTVVPLASGTDLDNADVACVGEQFRDYIGERLGVPPEGIAEDEEIARMWLPLADWLHDFHLGPRRGFVTTNAYHLGTSQYLQAQNWLDTWTHLRRVSLVHIGREPVPPYRLTGLPVISPGQFGRVCPYCNPEGPNIGLIFELSRGATIEDGRIVPVEGDPIAALGQGASCVPFLEYDDPNRLLMGVNMMRQWVAQPDPCVPMHETGHFADYQKTMSAAGGMEPERALVQTGNEPDTPYFWAGRNVLTAFVSWDADAFEDAIVVSESLADRMRTPEPLEPGDKLSNRHGFKGVVSRVLPDAAMPTLEDGAPVELIYSVCGLPSRLTVGVLKEAVIGRVAKQEGGARIVPSFGAPSDAELKAMLKKSGISEDGMETLRVEGESLRRRSTVGYVYWGVTSHLAREKLQAVGDGETDRGQHLGDMEVHTMLEMGACETLKEQSHTCASHGSPQGFLSAELQKGVVQQAETPGPAFERLKEGLSAAGIRVDVGDGTMSTRFDEPEGDRLTLAQAVPHPWFPEQMCLSVGTREEEIFGPLSAANERLGRMLEEKAPPALVMKASEQVQKRLADYVDALVSPSLMRIRGRVRFSGRTVVTPGGDLRHSQIGLPEEMAWTLFGPQAAHKLGDAGAVQKRTAKAADALDEVMATAWVLMHRAPTRMPTAFIGFQPIRIPGNALRVHPVVCQMNNMDFDGDQAAIFLPLTGEGQEESKRLFSIEGHLRRDPGLISDLGPRMDAAVGLAALSRTKEGHGEIETLAGCPVSATSGFVIRWDVGDALKRILEKDGPADALSAAQRLTTRGFEEAKRLGLSMTPFLPDDAAVPPKPSGDDVDQWVAYAAEVRSWVEQSDTFDGDKWGPLNLLSKSGARSSSNQLKQLLGGVGTVHDTDGRQVVVKNGWYEGVTAEEAFARVPGARLGLAAILHQVDALEELAKEPPYGRGVLSRARDSRRPGVVLARAAANGEVDRLDDPWSRLFVGMKP